MEPVALAAIYGGFGGLIRGLGGLYKIAKDREKGTILEEFKPALFGVSLIISASAGVLIYYMTNDMTPLALIGAGFAGIDVIETMFKTK